MLDDRIALENIVDRIPDIYNTNEGWVVKKMKLEYTNRIATNLPIMYQKDKVQYFNNKFAMMMSKVYHGKSINWVAIMFSQLVKELIKQEKCQKNMIEGIAKRELKKDVCHSARVLEVNFKRGFHQQEQSHRRKEVARAKGGHEKKREFKERFIKNKRPLNPTCISLKKEKQPNIRINRKAI